MLIIEYRITLPLALEEYQKAQLFTLRESLKSEVKAGKVHQIRNERFQNNDLHKGHRATSGLFTTTIYQWSSKFPLFVKSLLPKEATEVREESWDSYPYCRTIITNSICDQERFHIKIETIHVANDRGELENVHELPEDVLKHRQVIYIDIANDEVSSKEYRAEEDPKLFKSIKTGRGPLMGRLWHKTCEPVMTCYKLVTCEFKSFGLQNTFEYLLQRFERKIFTQFHRQLFCSIDKWIDLKLENIRNDEGKGEDKIDLKEVVETKN